jgi:hypothetical protein
MNILEILYGPSIFIVKMSILVQYLKLLAPNRTVNPIMFWGSWIIIWTSLIFYTTAMFLAIFAYNPRPKIRDDAIPGTCVDYYAVNIARAVFNIISDVAILILPARTVWLLRIPRRKKVATTALFATGIM